MFRASLPGSLRIHGMKRFHWWIMLLLCLFRCAPEKRNEVAAVNQYILEQNRLFLKQAEKLIGRANAGEKNTDTLQAGLNELRDIYKRMEWAVAFFMPETTRFLNGPNLEEVETEENLVYPPEGLQVLEELVYPGFDYKEKDELLRQLKLIVGKAYFIENYFTANQFSENQILQALRNEVFRITTLGIAGFDTPVSGRELHEVQPALKGVAEVFLILDSSKERKQITDSVLASIQNATVYLNSRSQNKETFDYLLFIRSYLNPISNTIFQYKRELGIGDMQINHVLNPEAPNLFSKNAFQVDAFAPGESYATSPEKAALGKQLFHNTGLSGGRNRSCASCHQPDRAYTDGLKTPLSLSKSALLRNTPSLNYAGFQFRQFWDMRSTDLEGQVADVIQNRDEMHGDLSGIVEELNRNPKSLEAFRKIYKSDKIETWQVKNALSAFIRSLPTFSSRFDKYMQGDDSVLIPDQKRGFNLFVGKGRCASCHFIPLFNGTVPPEYNKTESEVLGIAKDHFNKSLDPDPGRGKFNPVIASLQHAFKTPTLRNVSRTAPYMHNGAYPDMNSVMDFYNKGGGNGLGFSLKNQTLPADPLDLTPSEIQDIIRFMEALNDL